MKKLILSDEEHRHLRAILREADQKAANEAAEAYRIAESWSQEELEIRRMLAKIENAEEEEEE